MTNLKEKLYNLLGGELCDVNIDLDVDLLPTSQKGQLYTIISIKLYSLDGEDFGFINIFEGCEHSYKYSSIEEADLLRCCESKDKALRMRMELDTIEMFLIGCGIEPMKKKD